MAREKKSPGDFSPAMGTKPLVEEGTIYNGETNINISSILTKLIQEAGRWCKHYASDLFIDWEVISDRIKHGTLENASYLFGFREMGVDGVMSVLANYRDRSMANMEYRSLWRLDIQVDPRLNSSVMDVTFTLQELSRI